MRPIKRMGSAALLVVCCCIGLFAESARAQHQVWDDADKVIAGIAFTAMAVDWGQTRYIAKHPGLHFERNPLLGEHPSTSRVDAFFIGTAISAYLIADALPTRYRKLFLGGVAVVHIVCVTNNYGLGIRVDF